VRAYSSPPTYVLPALGNLTDDVVRNAGEAPEAAQFSRRDDAGDWQDVTAAEFLAQVSAVAKGLIAAGIDPGDRVAILSATRYEWTLFDYAIWFAGAVGVPIYETSVAAQIGAILSDSGAVAVVAERPDHLARIASVRARAPELIHVWSIEDNAVAVLSRLGADIDDDVLEVRRTQASPADLATLIYTSGTTGEPRGCPLTHGNFMYELGVAVEELPELFADDDAATLLFLPLAHVFARIIEVGCVKTRVRLGHTPDITNLATDLREFRPTFVLAVPRVFEKVFNTASQKATAEGRGRVFERAAEVAIAYSRALDTGKVPMRLRAQHAAFSRLVYAKLRAALGGRCAFAVSGGAPMGERLGHFFRGLGITVLEGYGLTETTGALTVNTVSAVKIGSVGRPFPGTSVRVAEDGELLFRGGQVFAGYWGAPAESAAAGFRDGWFCTGDIGEIDDEGFVRITGRKKEMIVTAGGKNVSPAILEDRVRAHSLVGQCLVVGDGQPFIAALITLDPDALSAWAQARGLPDRSLRDFSADPEIRAAIDAAVTEANRAVSQAESIRKFEILPIEWTEELGLLTPSLKLKRAHVMREFKDQIARLYAR
jgi:long-chain acyl-CoA synthetase